VLKSSHQRSLDLKNLNMKKKLLEGMVQHRKAGAEAMIFTVTKLEQQSSGFGRPGGALKLTLGGSRSRSKAKAGAAYGYGHQAMQNAGLEQHQRQPEDPDTHPGQNDDLQQQRHDEKWRSD